MINLPTLPDSRKAVRYNNATRLQSFIATYQPAHPAQAKDWRQRLTVILREIEADNAPRWKHWTDILGRPHNWRELAPETQRRWIEGRCTAIQDNETLSIELVSRIRSEALADVGQALPAEPSRTQ